MGMYTELNICFDLKSDTPQDVIDVLHYLIDDNVECPKELPIDPLFKTERWRHIAKGSSYYFDGLTNSKMEFDEITECWKVNIRSNLKNYDNEILFFLWWLEDNISTNGFIGYMRYEEWDDPKLIYVDNGEIQIE